MNRIPHVAYQGHPSESELASDMRWSFSFNLVLPATNFLSMFSSTYVFISSFLSSLILSALLRSVSSYSRSKIWNLFAWARSIFSNRRISASSSSRSFCGPRLGVSVSSSSSSSSSKSSSLYVCSTSRLSKTRSPFFSSFGFYSKALGSIILL